MKQITVYGLLSKVYNKNDDMPKIIEYGGREYEWTGTNYYNAKNDEFIEKNICLEDLHDEVEIIEENNKIEKIDIEQHGEFIDPPSTFELANKINQIIDVINETKKGE